MIVATIDFGWIIWLILCVLILVVYQVAVYFVNREKK